jgi:hypothetical protein
MKTSLRIIWFNIFEKFLYDFNLRFITIAILVEHERNRFYINRNV